MKNIAHITDPSLAQNTTTYDQGTNGAVFLSRQGVMSALNLVPDTSTGDPCIMAMGLAGEAAKKCEQALFQPVPTAKTGKSYDFFPEGTEVASLPKHVKESLVAVKKLEAEKQSKISYELRGKDWCISVDGVRVLLKDESSEEKRESGIYGKKHFTRKAARAQAKMRGLKILKSIEWQRIVDCLGIYHFKDVLQIRAAGYVSIKGSSGQGKLFDESICEFWCDEENWYLMTSGLLFTVMYEYRGPEIARTLRLGVSQVEVV